MTIEELKRLEVPMAYLTTGVAVLNFSSPHPFEFLDGTILPACDPDRARHLALIKSESTAMMSSSLIGKAVPEWDDVSIEFRMSDAVRDELNRLCDTCSRLHETKAIVLVPLPVLECVRRRKYPGWSRYVRGVVMADRVLKMTHHNRFAV